MSNFFFQAKKKEAKKSPGHLRLCPGLKPPVAIINCSPLWLQTVHRTVCLTRRARNALKLVRSFVASRPQRSFGMRENKRLFSHCRDRRPRLSVIFFFQVLKKKQKSRWDTCDCVPGLKPRVAIINCSPLWLQTVHRTVCGARRARNAFW